MKKILSILLLTSLTACTGSEVKSTLGLKKKAPDEFMVLSRPALTVPPSFDLPEPQSASLTPPKDVSANNAKQVIFGATTTKKETKVLANNKKANAENIFLNKAGVEKSQSDIRSVLEEDIRAEQPAAPEQEEKGFFGRLFEPIKLDEKPDPVVNPQAEKDRIKENKARGEKVDGNETETVQPKGESVLDRIF